MKHTQTSITRFLTLCMALIVAFTVSMMPTQSLAAGGSNAGGGGGGTPKPLELRVIGYVTSINYVNSTVTIGASYYGSSGLKVTSSTGISLNNINCSLGSILLGDWAEARYEYFTKNATKLTVTRI